MAESIVEIEPVVSAEQAEEVEVEDGSPLLAGEGIGEVWATVMGLLDIPYVASALSGVMGGDREQGLEPGWSRRLADGFDLLGVQSACTRLTARDARATVYRLDGVLITWRELEQSWLVLREAHRGRVEGRSIDDRTGRAVALKLTARELLALLGGGDESMEWVIVEPRLTMQVISPPGGHDLEPSEKALKRLKGFIWLEREGIWAIAAYSLLLGFLSLLTPLAVQLLVSTITFGLVLQPLIVLTGVVLVGLAFVGALHVLQHITSEYIERRLFVRLVTDLSYRLPRVEFEAHEKKHVPELVNYFFDVVSLQKTTSSLLLSSLGLALQLMMGLIVLAFYHPYLLGFAVSLTISLFIVVFVMGRGAVKTSLVESDAKYAAAAWLQEIVHHPLSFRSQRGGRVAAARAEALSLRWLGARAAHFRILLRQIVGTVVVQALANGTLLGLGGYLVLRQQLTLGQLVAAELIVSSVTYGVSKFGKDLENYYDLVASGHKIGKLVDLPLEPTSGESPRPQEGGMKVELSGIGLARGSGKARHISLTVSPGERIGITSQDGASLTTLLDLLYGLRAPTEGHIKFDDARLQDLSLAQVRDLVSIVRGHELFDGTIEENLRLGQRCLSMVDLRQALQAIGILDELERLKDGLETHLGTTGAPLSLDQQHRLTLARALLSKPRLTLIDQSLDPLHIQQIDDVLEALRGSNSTTIISTSRLAVLLKCDRVFELTVDGLKPMELPRGADGQA